MSAIDNIPNMSVDKINILRKNALSKLDDPKQNRAAEAILDAIDKELERRYIPGMIVTFEERYPGGFYGDKQAKEERDYKVDACEKFSNLLGQAVYYDLLAAKDYDKLLDSISKAVNLTNFIQGSFEKPVLLDAIKSNKQKLIEALYQFLWGENNFKDRFDLFVSVLEDMKINKWTYATYFLFLSNPDENMFVKPEMLKKSIDISKYPISYDPKPTYDLYIEILEFCAWLKSKISILKPRDMIDVHSFMWHMAPTGKWSDEKET